MRYLRINLKKDDILGPFFNRHKDGAREREFVAKSHKPGDKDVWAVEVFEKGQWVQRFPFLNWDMAFREAIEFQRLLPDYNMRLRHMATGDTIPLEVLGDLPEDEWDSVLSKI